MRRDRRIVLRQPWVIVTVAQTLFWIAAAFAFRWLSQ